MTPDRVTYATLAAGQTDDFKKRYDRALGEVRAGFGGAHGHRIAGREVLREDALEDRSPADTRVVLGRFALGSTEDVDEAVAAARRGFQSWSATPWPERARILRRAADLIELHGFELSALAGIEAGKSRLEAMGDVTETADLLRYYCDQMQQNDGFDRAMGRLNPREETRSVLRPYGVWAVISPFNFPAALAGGPTGAALLAGNTVVLKPSHETPYTALGLYQAFIEAGVPPEALQLLFGPGQPTGEALASHPDVDGILFTGSKAVGMSILRRFARDYPKPCIAEMGGKNPALVMSSADLDAAADGVVRSAFGLQGQKCSACSRVYVQAGVKKAFVDRLLDATSRLRIGDPSQDGIFLGPVIHQRAFSNYESYVDLARKEGTILAGGRSLREGELAYGYFVAPTIVDDLPKDHALFREEMFLPILCVAEVSSLEEGISWANRTEYGLTAGLFTTDSSEIDSFLEKIAAGVVYLNRRAGATTGAWPGVQPFGGWKGSGTTGKASGGVHYLQQFMREQSRTIVHP